MRTTNHSIEELEAKLISRFGTKTHFTIPDGYFDSLTGKVMNRVAKRQRRRLLWRWAAAAMLAGCVAAGGLLLEKHNAIQTANTEDIQYIEDALDYSMIDNMSIATYLTEVD
jgi:hypothetical protein